MTTPVAAPTTPAGPAGGPRRWPWRSAGRSRRWGWAITGRARRRMTVAAGAAVVVLVATALWGRVDSAYTANLATGSNSWTTGTVSFDTNTPAGVLFNVSGVKPGSTQTACVRIRYTGSLTARVRLYVNGALTGSGLGSYLTLQVNEGTGAATGGSCSDFSSTANLYNSTGLSDTTKTVAAFASASSNYATGVSNWSATNGGTKTYQFVWRLRGANAAQGLSVGATFTWEAQS